MASEILIYIRTLAKSMAEFSHISGFTARMEDNDHIEFSADSDQLQHLKNRCQEKNLIYEDSYGSILVGIGSISQQYGFFIGLDEFKSYYRKRYTKKESLALSYWCVIEPNGAYIVVENNEVIESRGLVKDPFEYVRLFYTFAHIMRGISQYVDEATHTYVLFTSNKGVVKIGLGDVDTTNPADSDLVSKSIKSFEYEIENGNKKDFIISAIIERIDHCDKNDLSSVISHLDTILQNSIRDYQLFTEQFSFDGFKTKWDK